MPCSAGGGTGLAKPGTSVGFNEISMEAITTEAIQAAPGGCAMKRGYELTHLESLESEGIHIFREVAAEFEKPVLLFSGGKDSIVLLRLAEKAFWPAPLPFPLMHVDTGHNFPEVVEFRDKRVAELNARLIVASVPHAIERGLVQDVTGIGATRNRLQT